MICKDNYNCITVILQESTAVIENDQKVGSGSIKPFSSRVYSICLSYA